MPAKTHDGEVPASFRDPSGFLFTHQGDLYRQVNHVYRDDYDHLMGCGLYEALVGAGLLIPHDEADAAMAMTDQAYKVIRPARVPFVSYPYEWSFSQLKDAALATLRIQSLALDHGMSLKDSSAYNIQFHQGRCTLIDTLSFERYEQGRPWVAYRQFCQHFLAPLALMSRRDIRLGQLLRVYIDGVPLDLASKLLGVGSRLRLSTLVHIHMHARSQKKYEGAAIEKGEAKMRRFALLGLLDSLRSAVRKLKWQPGGTEWGQYYTFTNYSPQAFERKKELVASLLDQAQPKSVWDLGANTGVFSRLASDRGIFTVAFDVDPAAVERNYLDSVERRESCILPLVLDLTNPSGAVGWASQERMSLAERGPVDTVLALALIHHLAISNNVPLDRVARFLDSICRTLIIEFVPKSDSQVQKLLATREDIFSEYDQAHFESAFGRYFAIDRTHPIEGTERRLYLMRSKSA